MTKFNWSTYPQTTQDFEALMVAIDSLLTKQGLRPSQRPFHVGRKLWEAFGWSGTIFPPKELAGLPGFDGDVLIAKAQQWYEDSYGERLNGDSAYGYAPVRLGNATWLARAGVTYGTVRVFFDRNLQNRGLHFASGGMGASLNVLTAVEGLPQGLVNRLSERELREYLEFHVFMHENLQWRDELPRTELLMMARADYDESTVGVYSGRYSQARWAAEQAVEKTLKGLMSIAGTSYPTGGPNGHNLDYIGQILCRHHGVKINRALLSLVECSPKVRYGEEVSSEEQALSANHAVLGVLEQLRKASGIASILVRAGGAN